MQKGYERFVARGRRLHPCLAYAPPFFQTVLASLAAWDKRECFAKSTPASAGGYMAIRWGAYLTANGSALLFRVLS